MPRKLTLNRESLSELTGDDLAAVVGAAPEPLPTTPDLGACLTFKGSRCIYV